MRVSVVIPTYNRRELLDQTLLSLLEQEEQDGCEIEIIVVDDGSVDGTNELLRSYETRVRNLVCLFRSRTESEVFWPARVRNLGIQHSTGEIILFLDCGIVIPPDFIRRVSEHYLTTFNQVLIHYIVGAFTLPTERNQQRLADLSPKNIRQKVQQLAQDPEWMESRAGLFDLVNDQLDQLPAPWTLAWAGAMSVSRNLLEQIGGFDEAFQGWGGEDTDLGFRLYRSGASFVATRDCIALHLPHERVPQAQLFAASRENRRRLHRKFYRLETELLFYYPGSYYNQVLAYYNHLVSMYTLPQYSPDILTAIYSKFLQDKAPSLLIGTDNTVVAKYLVTTHNFVWNVSTLERFRAHFPEREVEYLLGCSTHYDDKYFDVIVLTDFMRSLPKVILRDFLTEVSRIGKNVFCIYTNEYFNPFHQIDEGPYLSSIEIQQLLTQLQLQLVVVSEFNDVIVLEIHAGGAKNADH